MKTQITTYFALSFLILAFYSCNPKKAIEEKIAKEMAGAMLGTDVDMSNTDSSKPSSAKVDLKKGSESINFDLEGVVFNVMKDNQGQLIMGTAIAQDKEDNKIMIMLGITGDASLIKGASAIEFGEKKEGKLSATLTMNKTGSEEEMKLKGMMGMKVTSVKSGTMELVKLTEEEIIFKINGVAEDMSMGDEEMKESPFTGTITCKNPVITFMGMKKDEFFK